MSEHIQPAPTPHAAPTIAAQTHERTPGVQHEREGFNFRLVIGVGIGLVVTAVVVHLAVWWLFRGLEQKNALPNEGASDLALEDAARPIGERLENVPAPHLEGIERDSSILVVRNSKGEEKRFFVSFTVNVHIDNHPARLFDLREGQRVTATYFMPNGVGGAIGVVTAVTSPPPEKSSKNTDTAGLPDVTQTVDGTVERIVPRSPIASREWADAQKDRFGWIDRDKGIVHVPLDAAMDEVLKSGEFRSEKGKKSDGRIALPSRSNSGRELTGGKR